MNNICRYLSDYDVSDDLIGCVVLLSPGGHFYDYYPGTLSS